MTGIYIHVPFCKKKCLYCDFYSLGISKKTEHFHLFIEKELKLRKEFIPNEKIDTIYFGGGTPSLLTASQVEYILHRISKEFTIAVDAEITIEVNPDDVTSDLMRAYRVAGINRVSIGIQSFIDEELKFMGRRHNAYDAEKAVEISISSGFDNISIDLIYGIPNSTIKSWELSLNKAFSLNIQHLSCYHLTFEEGTPLTRKLNKKVFTEIDEATSVAQFNLLQNMASAKSFIHYEISNLAKEGFYSKHNTAYWKGIPYLGLGPAAHSYNKRQRTWNPHSYQKWEMGIESGMPNIEQEDLNEITLFNEMILTRLRTIWGLNIEELRSSYNPLLVEQMLSSAKKLIEQNLLKIDGSILHIPSEQFLVSDGIISSLLVVED